MKRKINFKRLYGDIVQFTDEFNDYLLFQQGCFSSDEQATVDVILPEYNHVEDISEIIRLVLSVVDGDTFIRERVAGNKSELTKLGRKLLLTLSIDSGHLLQFFSGSKLSPYIHVFNEMRNNLLEDCDDVTGLNYENLAAHDHVGLVRRAIDLITAQVSTVNFKRYLRNCERAVNKNSKSFQGLVDGLFKKTSRMLVLRLDIGYSLAYLQSQCWKISLDRVKEDFSTYLRLLRRGRFEKSLCGYVWKLEFGPTKQYHYHLMIFLDGAKHQADITICEELGELWRVKVTSGAGCYFNCNGKKERYSKKGIGMIEWKNAEAIDNLKLAGSYLVKKDLLIRPNLKDNERTFGRSAIPRLNSKQGRPRLELLP